MMEPWFLDLAIPVAVSATIAGTIGWVITTWLRVKHGYPLETSWGNPVYPRNDQAVERVRLLTQENAQLQAEIGALKDRLANVERIVTDSSYHLSHEIARLRDEPGTKQ